MPKNKIVMPALLNAVLAAAYISLIAFLMMNAEAWFGPAKGPLGFTAFLLTFVVSAAIIGTLVLPVQPAK